MASDPRGSADVPSDWVQTVEAALDIVEFLRQEGRADLTPIAEELDLAVSTVYRHLTALYHRDTSSSLAVRTPRASGFWRSANWRGPSSSS